MSRIVGIDLGTSTSEIACVVNSAPKLIPNTLGKLVTPSVVHIGEDGAILVGEEAVEYLFTRPDCTFMEVKRLPGSEEKLKAHEKEYAPEEIQAMLLRYLASCAETYLKEKISHAVITVPAYFTDGQRRGSLPVCMWSASSTSLLRRRWITGFRTSRNVRTYWFTIWAAALWT
jgi:molecular chaperone DnaK